MKIKIEIINKKQIYHYSELAPIDILENAHSDKTVTAIAHVSENGDENNNTENKVTPNPNSSQVTNANAKDIWTPAGMMQYTVSDDSLELNWIYVYYQFRNMGVGGELIKLLSDIPESSKFHIKVRLYEHLMDEMPISEVCSFLKKRGLNEGEHEEEMYYLTGKYIFRNLSGLSENEAASLKKSIEIFSRCTPDMLIKAAEELKIKDKNSVLVADKNISLLLQSSKGHEGILIAEKRGDIISVKEIIATSDTAKEKLLKAFFYSLIKRIKYTDMVLISELTVDDDVISEIFPDLKKEKSFFLEKGLVKNIAYK